MTRDEYVDLLKKSALDIGKRSVMKLIASKIPFFAGGIPGWFAGLVVGKILEIAITQTEFGAFFLYIDMRVDAQGNEFEKAALAYHNAATPEEKLKNEKAYLDSFHKFASFKS